MDKTKQQQINNIIIKKCLISGPVTASADAWFDDDDGGGVMNTVPTMTDTNITARGWR